MSISAEVICVGTELLLGDITNTNARFLAGELAQLGVPHYYQTVVGDNVMRLKKVIAVACERSRLLLFTGGLGPTPDDLTTEVIADFFDVPLVEDPDVLADITEKFAQRGRAMAPSNRKQALRPKGSMVLPNPLGTAPGIIWQPRTGLTIMTFPGVPSEMHAMWRNTAVSYLKQQGWGQEVIFSRTLKFWGIGESALAEKVTTFFDLANPTVAPYASEGVVKLRISARAGSDALARQMIDPIDQQLRQIGGIHFFGTDDDTLASVTGELLQTQAATVAVAESCTGGGLGKAFTDIAGSSRYFRGGITAYDNEIKQQTLNVQAETLAAEGAVSHAVAQQMAAGVQALMQTDWGLSVTGIAGPGGGTETKPVGLVYIGIAKPDRSTESLEFRFGARRNREWIRLMSVQSALDVLRRSLQG